MKTHPIESLDHSSKPPQGRTHIGVVCMELLLLDRERDKRCHHAVFLDGEVGCLERLRLIEDKRSSVVLTTDKFPCSVLAEGIAEEKVIPSPNGERASDIARVANVVDVLDVAQDFCLDVRGWVFGQHLWLRLGVEQVLDVHLLV